MYRKLVSYFIPAVFHEPEERYRRYKLVVGTIIITFLFDLDYISLSAMIGLREGVWLLLFALFWYVFVLFLIKNGMEAIMASNLYVLIGVLTIDGCIYYSGGFSSPVLPWLASSPIVALLLAGKSSGFFWLIINTLTVVVFGLMDWHHFPFPVHYGAAWANFFFIDCYGGLVLIIFVVALVFENGKNTALKKLSERNVQIEKEKQKSEALLLNILPAEVSEELKQTGKTKAHSYNLATVMFSDFVNFTKVGSTLSPEELVSAIGDYFETFDNIVEEYGIEKIKTVGDAYICAAGLPIPTTDNALIMINVAIDFLRAIEALNERRHISGHVVFDVRIGVNTGPLVAGVVGIKKFAYDIWGDTVNTAARLQEMGEKNRINISETTYELVKHRFNCTYRGRIEAKNKGEIDMYFVEGIRKQVLV